MDQNSQNIVLSITQELVGLILFLSTLDNVSYDAYIIYLYFFSKRC